MGIAERLYVDKELMGKYLSACSTEYRRQNKPGVTEVENHIVLPAKKVTDSDGVRRHIGGIVDNDFKFYEPSGHLHHLGEEKAGSMTEAYTVEEKDIVSFDKTVLYGGLILNHLGHFLVECSTRLWYWVENGDPDLEVIFVVEKEEQPSGRVKEFLSLMGIRKVSFIEIPTRFKKIIVPEDSSVMDGFFTEEFMTPFRAAALNIEAESFDKVYLSRGKFKSSVHIYGENDLEDVFRNNGYKVVYPETLSLKEQIAYIKGAKDIACVMGTAAHLFIFAAPGTKSVTLERTDEVIEEQILINQAARLNWSIVSGHMNFLPVKHSAGPIILGINTHAARYFTDNKFRFDRSKINRPKESRVRKVCFEWFGKYSSPSMNLWLEGIEPLFAKRVAAYCSKAFLSLRQRLFLVRTDGNTRIYRILGMEFRKKRYAVHKKIQ